MCGAGGQYLVAKNPLMPSFLKKPMMKGIGAITPKPLKEFNDAFLPDSARKDIIKAGGKSMLANPNSEAEQAVNVANAEAERQRVQRAFAAKYNNQVRML